MTTFLASLLLCKNKLSLFLLLVLCSFNAQANFQFNLSSEAKNAINSGVSLSFNCDFAQHKTVPFLPFIKLVQHRKRHTFTLSRHALSNQYIVHQSDTSDHVTFRSVSLASSYIAIQGLLLLERYNRDKVDNYYSMRLFLNKYKLPSPVRLYAFVAPQWDNDTQWHSWKSVN